MSFPIRKDLGEELFSPATKAELRALKDAQQAEAINRGIAKAIKKNRDLIAKVFITQNVAKRVDKSTGATLDFVVKVAVDGRGWPIFASRAEAEGFALEIFKAKNRDLYADEAIDPNGEPDPTSTHVNSGTQAMLDDDNANFDPNIGREPARARIDRSRRVRFL